MPHRQTFRRPKIGPNADAWHTLRVGAVIFVFLLVCLPLIL